MWGVGVGAEGAAARSWLEEGEEPGGGRDQEVLRNNRTESDWEMKRKMLLVLDNWEWFVDCYEKRLNADEWFFGKLVGVGLNLANFGYVLNWFLNLHIVGGLVICLFK